MLRIFYTSMLIACMPFVSSQAHAADSLYRRLGGQPVIEQAVDRTIAQVANDPRVNHSFDQVNIKRLNKRIVEQICSLTGGGCIYTGDEMKLVHQGLNIDERAFYALVEALRQALNDLDVGEREKNELLVILAPMKRLIVEK
tara:strand:- start:785 stop:1210 length:426 start_codon:yes stop_codon:yes gene_type:complete